MARRRGIQRKDIHAEWWEPHEGIVIRSMRGSDIDAINDEMAEMNAKQDNPDEEAVMRMKLGTVRRLTLRKAIVSWTFTDENHRPLPLCPEELDELANEDVDFIYKEIDKISKRMTKEEKKPSSMSVSNGTGAAPSLSLVPSSIGP